MGKSNMEQDILKVLMSEEQLQKRVREMGDELYDRFHDKDPIFVGVLKEMCIRDRCPSGYGWRRPPSRRWSGSRG